MLAYYKYHFNNVNVQMVLIHFVQTLLVDHCNIIYDDLMHVSFLFQQSSRSIKGAVHTFNGKYKMFKLLKSTLVF